MNKSGNRNVFLGYHAGFSNDTASYNVFIGNEAGNTNRFGRFNTFLGYQSGFANNNSDSSVFIGYKAGFTNNGASNVFLGVESGYSNSSGIHNDMMGYQSGHSNTTGQSNVMIGTQAGFANTKGSYNVFLGHQAGNSNNGSYNTFLGYKAGYFNDTAKYNTFLGYEAGYGASGPITGNNNVSIGYESGMSITTGYDNVFIGNIAGLNATNYVRNVLIGRAAGWMCQVGEGNVFVGYGAGAGDPAGAVPGDAKGQYNTFIGNNTAKRLLLGDENVYIGDRAGCEIRHGQNSVIIGGLANYISGNVGYNIDNNVYIGYAAAAYNANGSQNTMIGQGAGYTNTGSNNVFIGKSAGANEIGSNKLYVDVTNTSSPLIWGDFSARVLNFNGKVGIGTTSPSQILEIGGTDSKISLNSASSNMVLYNTNGVAAPSYITRSLGTKVVLWPSVGSGMADYALGIEPSTLWFSIPISSNLFKFYAGTTELMRITGTGNVGIGTTSPSFKLDVKGRERILGDGTNSTGIWYSNLAGTANRAFIGMNDDNSIGFYGIGILNFGLNMNVNNGNVGIGTTSPAYLLDVNGNCRFSGDINISTGANRFINYPDITHSLYIGGSPGVTQAPYALHFLTEGPSSVGVVALSIVGSNGNVGIGNASPGYKLTVNGTTWCTSGAWSGSDLRWKKNIRTLHGALSEILALRGVRFDWRKEEFPDLGFENGEQIGLIAQEVEKVFPELVRTDNKGYKAVAYDKLGAVLVEAVKDQQQQIETIQKENQSLKSRNDELLKRLEKIEQLLGEKVEK